MIKTEKAGGSADFMLHPMIQKSMSSFPDPEDISFLAVEACLMDYPTGIISFPFYFIFTSY